MEHLGIPDLKQQNCLGDLEKQKLKLLPGTEDLPGPAPLGWWKPQKHSPLAVTLLAVPNLGSH